jgi:dephospho-CoA kinase
MKFPLKVGITGGIGSGKTMVCRILETMGYPVFYSDNEAKRIMSHHPQVRDFLIKHVGEEAYGTEGLNRALLAEKLFSNPQLLSQVNELVHPLVRQAFDEFVAAHAERALVFNEAAILFETGAYKRFDAIVLITADEITRIRRVVERDGVTEMEVRQRMNKQWSDNEKSKLTDYRIENEDALPLLVQVENVVNRLREEKEMEQPV